MARPRKTGLDYFFHDTDALDDEKIQALMMEVGGLEGYGFFFALAERIYRAPDCELALSEPWQKKIIAAKMQIEVSRFDELLASCLSLGLVEEGAGGFTSRAIQRRAEPVLEHRIRNRKDNGVVVPPTPPLKSKSKSKRREETTQKPRSNSAVTTQEPQGFPIPKHLGAKITQLEPLTFPDAKSEESGVWLTAQEKKNLIREWGEGEFMFLAESLHEYRQDKPKKWAGYSSHNHTLRRWRKMKLQDGYRFFNLDGKGPGYYRQWEIDKEIEDEKRRFEEL